MANSILKCTLEDCLTILSKYNELESKIDSLQLKYESLLAENDGNDYKKSSFPLNSSDSVDYKFKKLITLVNSMNSENYSTPSGNYSTLEEYLKFRTSKMRIERIVKTIVKLMKEILSDIKANFNCNCKYKKVYYPVDKDDTYIDMNGQMINKSISEVYELLRQFELIDISNVSALTEIAMKILTQIDFICNTVAPKTNTSTDIELENALFEQKLFADTEFDNAQSEQKPPSNIELENALFEQKLFTDTELKDVSPKRKPLTDIELENALFE